MDRFGQQVLLIRLVQAMQQRSSWCGETHIQKCAYFLKEGLCAPLTLNYVLYKHGPFSFELRDVLGEMRDNLLLNVEPRDPYGPSLLVSVLGDQLAARFPKTTKQYERQVEFIGERLATRGVSSLERLSTALFVLRENTAATPEQRAERIHELKPHINIAVARQAVEEVETILVDAKTKGLILSAAQ